MRIFKTGKSVLSFQNNAAQFLNGLTSNEIEKPNNAFLNIHGRIIATFDQLKISDDEVWACLESPFVDDVLKHLEKYIKLGAIKAEQLPHKVYFDLEGGADIKDGEKTIPQKKGRLIVTERDIQANVPEEEFTRFRLENNIPIHGVDYKDEMLLNVSTEDFVSFTKGCFLGQEPISKVHNRAKPTWRLVVKKESDCTNEETSKMTSAVDDPESGRKGFVFERNK